MMDWVQNGGQTRLLTPWLSPAKRDSKEDRKNANHKDAVFIGGSNDELHSILKRRNL